MKNKKLVIGYLIGFFALAISFFFDKQISNNVTSWYNLLPVSVFNNVSNILILFVLLSVTFLMWFQKKEWIPSIWAAVITSIAVAFVLKLIIARPRPIGVELLPYIKMVSYSFPSMHTTISFSLMYVLYKAYAKLTWVWLSIALVVAFDRVYSRVHYLSDVLAGAILGITISLIFIRLQEKKVFSRWIFSK